MTHLVKDPTDVCHLARTSRHLRKIARTVEVQKCVDVTFEQENMLTKMKAMREAGVKYLHHVTVDEPNAEQWDMLKWFKFDSITIVASSHGGMNPVTYQKMNPVIMQQAAQKVTTFNFLGRLDNCAFLKNSRVEHFSASITSGDLDGIQGLTSFDFGETSVDIEQVCLALSTHGHNLKGLTIALAHLTPAIMSALGGLPRLCKLKFSQCAFGDDDKFVAILAGCRKLTDLEFYGCGAITDDHINALAHLPLTRLALSDELIRDEALVVIANMKTLKTLEVSSNEFITDFGIFQLALSKSLRRLTITEAPLVTADGHSIMHGLCDDMKLVFRYPGDNRPAATAPLDNMRGDIGTSEFRVYLGLYK